MAGALNNLRLTLSQSALDIYLANFGLEESDVHLVGWFRYFFIITLGFDIYIY